jgi:hypothetical protein
MRWIFYGALSVWLLFGVSALAQEDSGRISVQLEKKRFFELVQAIESQSIFKFFFLEKWVDSVRVSVSAEQQNVAEVLTRALQGTNLYFWVDGNRIVITQRIQIIDRLDPFYFQNQVNDNRLVFQKEIQTTTDEKVEKQAKIIEVGRASTSPKATVTLSGYVRDLKSNEAIIGATIFFPKLSNGATTNTAGFYSINIPPGNYQVEVKYLGMLTEKKQLLVNGTGKVDFSLTEDVVSLKEVVVKADADANVVGLQIGKTTLDIKSIKNVPKVLGENDILRVALMLPGVKSVGEGAVGLNVRGGNADQNLMILNEATIYNPSHFLGFFSVFNADAIKTSELYKSGIPAQYGGRLSSIFDIQLKDGNQKEFTGYGGIGPVSARLNFEVPLKKEKTSITFGGRSTYSDWILKKIPRSTLSNANASFHDLSAKLTHNFSENSTLSASAYYSFDKFQLGNDSLFSYANTMLSLQWRNRIADKLHSQLNLTHSDYKYNIAYERVPPSSFDLGFGIKEYNAKWDFNYYAGKHKVDFGVQSKLYDANPGFINPRGSGSFVTPRNVQKERGLESALYIADNFDLTPKLSLYLGVRLTSFSLFGPGSFYKYQDGASRDNTSVLDTVRYASGQIAKTYFGPEYRASIRYSLPRQSSLKISYNRTRQYLHMLTNTVAVSPTTTWKLSDPNVLPQIGDQLAGGIYRNFFNNSIEASLEVYYKWMNNVLDYKIGSDLILNNQVEQDVLQGKGRAYGAELLVRKRNGKLNGWISYTYSRTFLQMDGTTPSEKINGGAYYPANYDKPHDVSLVGNYKFTRRYSLSFNFVYTTGRPITYPIGQYQLGGGYKLNYSERNEFRIPDYVRLDIGLNIEANHKLKVLAHGYWSFSIYNVLGRRNPYSIFFRAEDGEIKGYQLSIFGAPIPTITYNFRF